MVNHWYFLCVCVNGILGCGDGNLSFSSPSAPDCIQCQCNWTHIGTLVARLVKITLVYTREKKEKKVIPTKRKRGRRRRRRFDYCHASGRHFPNVHPLFFYDRKCISCVWLVLLWLLLSLEASVPAVSSSSTSNVAFIHWRVHPFPVKMCVYLHLHLPIRSSMEWLLNSIYTNW